MKDLTKIFFKLSYPKGHLCGGRGMTVLNPKYPPFSSGDTYTLAEQSLSSHHDAHLHPLTNVPTKCQPSTPHRIQESGQDFKTHG